jgi:hypothetical protein
MNVVLLALLNFNGVIMFFGYSICCENLFSTVSIVNLFPSSVYLILTYFFVHILT